MKYIAPQWVIAPLYLPLSPSGIGFHSISVHSPLFQLLKHPIRIALITSNWGFLILSSLAHTHGEGPGSEGRDPDTTCWGKTAVNLLYHFTILMMHIVFILQLVLQRRAILRRTWACRRRVSPRTLSLSGAKLRLKETREQADDPEVLSHSFVICNFKWVRLNTVSPGDHWRKAIQTNIPIACYAFII